MKSRRTWYFKNLPPLHPTEDADAALAGMEAESLAVLVGAGVSVNWPSGMPAAAKFLDAFYEECLPKSCDRRLFLPFNNPETTFLMSVSDLPTAIRFEVVVSVVQEKFDAGLELLGVFRGGRPNRNHRCLSELARRGALIITTNFDTLCEEACAGQYMVRASEQDFESAFAEGAASAPEFWHLHGVLADPRTGEDRRETVVASVRDCWNSRELFRLDRAKGRALERALSERDLLIVGYSGSDDFDIAPALEEARSARRLVWLNHTPKEHGLFLPDGITPLVTDWLPDGESWYRAPAANTLATMLSDGARRPDHVTLLRHDTAEALEKLAGLPEEERPEGGGEGEPSVNLAQHFAEWRRKFIPDVASQYLLAASLCMAGSLRGEMIRLLQEFLTEVLPALNSSAPESVSPSVVWELILMAVELGVTDLSDLEELPEFQQFLQEQPGIAAGVLTTQGRLLLRDGLVDEAVAAFKEALRLADSTDLLGNVEVVEYETANALFVRGYETGELKEAEEQAEKALRSAREVTNPGIVVLSTLLLGRVNERLGQIQFAREHYFKAYKEAYKTGSDALIAETSGFLGLSLWTNGSSREEYEEAARYLSESYRIYYKQEVWAALLRVGVSLAQCWEVLGDGERSLMVNCRAFDCAIRLRDGPMVRLLMEQVRAGAARVFPDKDFSKLDGTAYVIAVNEELRKNDVRV